MLEPVVSSAPGLLRSFADLKLENEHEFVQRDVLDLIRTIVSRVLCYAFSRLMLLLQEWRNGKDRIGAVKHWFDLILEAETVFADLLAAGSEYSLYASLRALQRKHETNPDFEYTLKGNAENSYCRSFITELFTEIYIPELEICREIFLEAVQKNKRELGGFDDSRFDAVKDRFYETPLEKMAPDCAGAVKKFPANLKKLADCFEHKMISTSK